MRIDGDISDNLEEYIKCLTKDGIVNLFMGALDEMQSWNGQSATSAICRATGAEWCCGGDGRTRWKLPTKAQLKRTFN